MSKLLLVDDDDIVVELMCETLKDAGLDVVGVTNGFDALEKLRGDHFDLLITDILMPDIDGLAVIDVAVASNQDVKVLAISGGGQDQKGGDLLEAALNSGADAILQKPFGPDELVRTARALLR